MNNESLKEKEAQKLKNDFDESISNIDAETASRITQARYRALEQLERKSRQWFLLPAGAIATAAFAVMIFISIPQTNLEPGRETADMDLISSSDELELYEELEFYEWLEDYELPS